MAIASMAGLLGPPVKVPSRYKSEIGNALTGVGKTFVEMTKFQQQQEFQKSEQARMAAQFQQDMGFKHEELDFRQDEAVRMGGQFDQNMALRKNELTGQNSRAANRLDHDKNALEQERSIALSRLGENARQFDTTTSETRKDRADRLGISERELDLREKSQADLVRYRGMTFEQAVKEFDITTEVGKAQFKKTFGLSESQFNQRVEEHQEEIDLRRERLDFDKTKHADDNTFRGKTFEQAVKEFDITTADGREQFKKTYGLSQAQLTQRISEHIQSLEMEKAKFAYTKEHDAAKLDSTNVYNQGMLSQGQQRIDLAEKGHELDVTKNFNAVAEQGRQRAASDLAASRAEKTEVLNRRLALAKIETEKQKASINKMALAELNVTNPVMPPLSDADRAKMASTPQGRIALRDHDAQFERTTNARAEIMDTIAPKLQSDTAIQSIVAQKVILEDEIAQLQAQAGRQALAPATQAVARAKMSVVQQKQQQVNALQKQLTDRQGRLSKAAVEGEKYSEKAFLKHREEVPKFRTELVRAKQTNGAFQRSGKLALKQIRSMPHITGIGNIIAALGPQGKDLAAFIEPLKSQQALTNIAHFREKAGSPGPMTQQEWPKFEGYVTSFHDPGMSAEALVNNLKFIMEYNDRYVKEREVWTNKQIARGANRKAFMKYDDTPVKLSPKEDTDPEGTAIKEASRVKKFNDILAAKKAKGEVLPPPADDWKYFGKTPDKQGEEWGRF